MSGAILPPDRRCRHGKSLWERCEPCAKSADFWSWMGDCFELAVLGVVVLLVTITMLVGGPRG
jgi:hypothetical protein